MTRDSVPRDLALSKEQRLQSGFKSTSELPRMAKQFIAASTDVCLCVLATWLAFYLRVGEFVRIDDQGMNSTVLSIMIALPIFTATGLYRSIFRFSGWRAIKIIATAVAIYGLTYATFIMTVGFEGTPRTIGIIQPILLFFGIASSRLLVGLWLRELEKKGPPRKDSKHIVIYGAGAAGRQLANALNNVNQTQLIGFCDDDKQLQGRTLNGLFIFAPSDLPNLILSKAVTHVFLAMPSISRTQRSKILNRLADLHIMVRTLPSMTDIVEGRVTVSDVRDLEIDDLFGRGIVTPCYDLLKEKVEGKTILITGAGGSIGSELSRQVLMLAPQNLLLLDVSEFALYSIHSELGSIRDRSSTKFNTNVVPLMCSIQDRTHISQIISTWQPDTIYHAAAYKHVPLVEHNVIEGVKNNVLGTLTVAEAAIKSEVSNFVLVSTDKAVRPTNVMGATKRLAEIILQALDSHRKSKTTFSAVRFGNVLASSGSVIPKFRSQIQNGGPITVTHPEINRFFMTIPEAAELVLQAGALAQGGEVFVLDMGEPIKIVDLAKRMIQLSGLTEKTTTNPEGDIEIQFTGLRPGEKLFEELLITHTAENTAHRKIMKAKENFTPWPQLSNQLKILKKTIDLNDVQGSILLLQSLVEGFKPNSRPEDHTHVGERKVNFTN
jgi:FlaA1/EpsC-like NDP-sugar epimerase